MLFDRIPSWLRPGGLALFIYATKEYTGCETFDGFKEFMGQRLFYSHKKPEDLYAALKKAVFRIKAAGKLFCG